MDGTLLLALYGTALFAASLLGSGLPRLFRMTHTRTQMVLSLISGLMLGVALLHLIPHAFSAGQAIDTVMVWTLSGLIFMLLLLRWFHFHQHDFASAAADCDLVLEVFTTDPGSVPDFNAFCRQTGHILIDTFELDASFRFLIRKTK